MLPCWLILDPVNPPFYRFEARKGRRVRDMIDGCSTAAMLPIATEWLDRGYVLYTNAGRGKDAASNSLAHPFFADEVLARWKKTGGEPRGTLVLEKSKGGHLGTELVRLFADYDITHPAEIPLTDRLRNALPELGFE